MWLRWLPIALGLTALALATPSGADVLRGQSGDCVAGAGNPSLAFDGTDYLVVWTSGHGDRYSARVGVCGSRVSRAGAVRDPGGLRIRPEAGGVLGSFRGPSVAFGGQNHLLAWSDGYVYANRVSRGGAVLDEAPLRLTSLFGNARPALAVDGTNHFVVWNGQGGVRYSRVSPDGNVLDPDGKLIGPGAAPAVAFDGTNFFVVWEGGCAGICGARVSPSGIVLDSAGIPIAPGIGFARNAAVAFDGTNYLVVWSTPDPGGNNLRYTRISPDGKILDRGFLGRPIGGGLLPTVTFAGGNYLVVWLRPIANVYEVYGARVSPSGTLLDPAGIRIASTSFQGAPMVAFGGTNSLVVWGDGAVKGVRVSSAGRVLDANPILISTPPIRCVVPRVVGFRLARAKARIRSANCRLGRVRRVRSTRAGRVLGQSPRAGTRRPRGTRVNLVIGVRR
jgi:PASTA domain